MIEHRRDSRGLINPMQRGYIIDTKKGVYVDVSALNEFQFNRYLRTQNNLSRRDLNWRQLQQFNKLYVLGQKILWIKHFQNMANLQRFFMLSTPTYRYNHTVQIFGPSLGISLLRQSPAIGYNRTDVQREKIAEFGFKRYKNAYDLGLVPSFTPEKDERFDAQKIAQVLRDRHGIQKVDGKITVSG